MQWNYKTLLKKENVYNKIIDLLNPCSPEDFRAMPPEEKSKVLKEMVAEIRKINIFPIYYFNEQGILEEIQKVIDKDVRFTQDALRIYNTEGLVLLDFLFPNLHTVISGHQSNKSVYDRFYDDEILSICLEKALRQYKITNLRTVFFSTGRFLRSTATNFSPLRAKAIYERFCPQNGVIYDYSAGFGGRMLGALSSFKNFTYIATDPNTETYNNLLTLGQYIEQATHRQNSYKILNQCSEDLILEPSSIDFAFSCPPYFSLEKYCNENTQSIIKFPDYDQWLENYVRPTIKNCYISLKDSGFFGVNIGNIWTKGKHYSLVNDWLHIAEEEGFFLKGIFPIYSHNRKEEDESLKDAIYIFTKSNEIDLPDYNNIEIIKKIEKSPKPKHQIAQYSITGKLEKTYDSIGLIQEYDISEIKKVLDKKQTFNLKFFRSFSGAKPPATIKIKAPIAIVDDIYFYSYAEMGRYLGVSRQSVQQSKNRNSKKIKNKEISWF